MELRRWLSLKTKGFSARILGKNTSDQLEASWVRLYLWGKIKPRSSRALEKLLEVAGSSPALLQEIELVK